MLPFLVKAQSPEPKRKTFHVTEVTETADECWDCTATLIRVSGFIKGIPGHATIQYGLGCTQYSYPAQNRTAHPTVCARVEAGEDYDVKVYPSAVSFWADGQRMEGYLMLLYDITSQKEVR
jgi:hypothetical protein